MSPDTGPAWSAAYNLGSAPGIPRAHRAADILTRWTTTTASPSASRPRSRCSRRSSPTAHVLDALVGRGAASGSSTRRPTCSPPTSTPGGSRPRPAGGASATSAAPARRACSTETGIRQLRGRPVFTTPNVFPPEGFEQEDVTARSRASASVVEPLHCYVCKEKYDRGPPLLRPALPDRAPSFNFAKRTETADLRGPGGAADRRAGEDRLPGRHQAAAGRRRADRHDPVPARLRPALRRGARLRRLGRPARDLRPRPAPHAERRGVLPPPRSTTRTGLDFIVNNACQTVRRPPAFYRHMMELETAALDSCRPGTAGADGVRGVELAGRAPVPSRPSCRSWRCSRATTEPGGHLFPERSARPGPPAGRPAGPELLAPHAGRGVVGGAARDAARERGGPVRAQRPPQAADAPHAGARQAHRERVGGRGAVLPAASRRPSTRTRTWRRPRST